MFLYTGTSKGERSASSHALLTTVAEVNDLEGSWGSFSGTMTLPMQQFSWIKACASTFSATQELNVVVCAAAGRALAIAPFVHRTIGGNGHLELVGLNELSEPADLLWSDLGSLERLAEALLRLQMPLVLGRLPEGSPSIGALRRAFRGRGVVLCREDAGYPVISLDESWKRPEDSLSTRRSSDLRRAFRKAEKAGTVRTEILVPRPEELDKLLDLAFAVEARSWKGRAKTALAADGVRGSFFRHFAEGACRDGSLRVCFLHVGDRTAAMQLAVECNDQFWLLKIGYDEEFSYCSPGNLLLRDTIKYAADRGLHSYVFLGSVEPWTAVWTSSERRCVSLRIYPVNLRGMAALAKAAGTAAYERVRRLLEPKGARRESDKREGAELPGAGQGNAETPRA